VSYSHSPFRYGDVGCLLGNAERFCSSQFRQRFAAAVSDITAEPARGQNA
jgi:hypothetical protein